LAVDSGDDEFAGVGGGHLVKWWLLMISKMFCCGADGVGGFAMVVLELLWEEKREGRGRVRE
jgi:hypothetical protein